MQISDKAFAYSHKQLNGFKDVKRGITFLRCSTLIIIIINKLLAVYQMFSDAHREVFAMQKWLQMKLDRSL